MVLIIPLQFTSIKILSVAPFLDFPDFFFVLMNDLLSSMTFWI